MTQENTYHVIKDPVHGTMQFTTVEDHWIKPFIDSPSFQRLRHIKQLGMGDFIFPGAVHTRFNHCIGCCYIASQIAHKIGLAEEERQLVMIACLLHDIGHGPFSHAFEDIFKNKLRHEAWTPFFLADFRQSDFFAQYNRINPRHHLTEEKFQLIEDMIMHKSPMKRVLADIVSSQLDADRLDYLLRDSHFCGVAYGEFDFRWMVHCMTIVESDQGERLGLTHKGIGAAEHYLMARRLMTRYVYLHHKKLAIEFYLIQLLASLSENLDHYAPFAEIKKTRLGEFLMAVNQFNQHAADKKTQQQFLADHFTTYKELSDYDVFAVVKMLSHMENAHPAIQLARRIHYRQMPKIVRIDFIDPHEAALLLSDFKQKHSFEEWQLAIIKTPHQSYSVDSDPILVVNEKGKVIPLNELSMMISAISDKHENTAFLAIDSLIAEEPVIVQFLTNFSTFYC